MRRPFGWILTLALTAFGYEALANTNNSLIDIAPDGQLLLVANNDNGSVTVIDAKGRKKLREFSVGKKPEGVSWIGDGPRALVTLYEERAVVLIDTAEGKVLKKIATAAEPYGVVVDKAGKRAWVSHEYPGVISEI